MLRKLALIAVATASLGLAALAPTTASAQGNRHHGAQNHHRGNWGHNNHHWRGPHFAHRPHFRPYVFGYGNSCIRTRWVPTPWGPQLRRVNVCR